MTAIYTTGKWKPSAGSEQAFIEAWTTFAAWASGMPGAGKLLLARDVRSPEVFVSFGEWEGIETVRAWKTASEFRERLARVLQHVADFEPTELAVLAAVEAGALRGIEPAHAS